MALPDLTGQNIENTYQRLVQTDGTNFYDGTGSVVNLGGDPFPYTGSAIITGSLILTGSAYISGGLATQYIDFNIDTVSPFQEGRIQWIGDTKTLAIDTDVNNFSIEVGHQTVIRGRNQTGFDFPTGTVVYLIGGNNSRPLFSTASWENDANSAFTIGIVAQPINNNNNGYAITNGIIRDINTSAFTAGDALYLSSSGQITNISPVAPRHNVRLGKVISAANNGLIHVDIDNGYELGELHNVLDTGSKPGDLLVVSNSLWINSKQLTGSYGLTGSLTATSLTSSLFGTSSWATRALTASLAPNYVLTSVTSSMLEPYVLNSQTSSFVTNSQTSSFVQNSQTSSFVLNSQTSSMTVLSSSFASTASYLNSLTQNVEILGNVTIYGTASVDVLVTNYQSSSIIYSSGSTKFGDTLDNTHQFTGSILATGSISSTGTVTAVTGSFSHLQGNSPITVGDSITFQQPITASSISASVFYGNGSNLVGTISSSYSATSSFNPNAIVTASATAGAYTIRLTKGNGTFFDVTLTQPPPAPPLPAPTTNTGSFFTNAALSNDRIIFTTGDRSFVALSLTSSYVLVSQTSSFVQNSQTSSFVLNNQTGSFVTNSQTSSFVQTFSFNNFTQSYYTDSASFDSRINNFSIDTSSLVTTSSFNNFTQSIQSEVNSLINATSSYVLNNQTSSFVNNNQTSSFVQNSQTGSFITNDQTSSMLEPYVLTSVTSSMLEPYVLNSQTSSFVQNSQTSSFIINSQTSSFVQNSQTSSMLEPYVLITVTSSMLEPYLLSSQTSSFVVNSQTGSFVTNNQTGSFVQNSQTSSFVLNNQTSSMLEPYLLSSQTGSFLTLNGSLLDINGDIQFNENRIRTSSTTVGQPGKGSDIAYDWGDLTTAPTAGRIVYFASGSGGFGWRDALANTTGSSAGLLGIATNSTSQDEILLKGTIKVSSSLSGLSAGQMVYLSNTVVGGVTGTAPSTSNHIIRVIGHVISPTDSTIYFNPDVSFAVIA